MKKKHYDVYGREFSGYVHGLAEEYVFSYGALFLYAGLDKSNSKEPVAGYWQYS